MSANPLSNPSPFTTNTKFNRIYRCTIQPGPITIGAVPIAFNNIVVSLPFTIEFDITRNSLSSANTCQIRIYNLGKTNRNQILFNAFNVGTFNTVTLEAGYAPVSINATEGAALVAAGAPIPSLTTIFYGNITEAWSVREGVNFITQIECYDGGFAYQSGDVNTSFVAGTPNQVVVQSLMALVPKTTFGACSIFPGIIQKEEAYQGNAIQILDRITGGAFFIDKGKTYVLKSSDFVLRPGPVQIIDADTGLLNTPVLEQTMMRFETLFNPAIDVGSLVEVISITYPQLTGTWIVRSVKHRGTISPVISGTLITTADFLYIQAPTPVPGT
jgi:hypothetical protein